jgi:predicted CXXCH cytochrome family protein
MGCPNPFPRSATVCYSCHDIYREEFSAKKYKHGPVAAGYCTSCHDPHGSNLRYQLYGKDKVELCLSCHEKKKEEIRKKSSIHGAITVYGCTGCHDAHGADYFYQLKKSPKIICISCHIDKRTAHRRHPVQGHPVKKVKDPLNPKRELGCHSCHDPHTSDGPSLLKGKTVIKTCLLCHKF